MKAYSFAKDILSFSGLFSKKKDVCPNCGYRPKEHNISVFCNNTCLDRFNDLLLKKQNKIMKKYKYVLDKCPYCSRKVKKNRSGVDNTRCGKCGYLY